MCSKTGSVDLGGMAGKMRCNIFKNSERGTENFIAGFFLKRK
jgi:hypothetical protein